LKEKRDRALLAVLLACGLRRHEAVELNFGHIQRREEHWAIVDMKGKAGHTRTIPMPEWVKNVVDQWIQAANITSGKLFRRVHKMGKTSEMKTLNSRRYPKRGFSRANCTSRVRNGSSDRLVTYR
jgi:integrase